MIVLAIFTRLKPAILVLALLHAVQVPGEERDAGPGRLYSVRGAKLYVEVHGKGAPIVFLHGDLLYFRNNFQKQLEFFSPFRRVIGIDQRGHGRSPDTDQPFSYREVAEDTADVIRQLRIPPADIVGHSGGGNVALILARYHPQLVRRVVVSGVELWDARGPEATERLRRRTAQEVSARLPPSFREDYVKVSPDGEGHWLTMVEKVRQAWLTPVILAKEELRAIRAPVLVMAGDRDFAPLEHPVEIYRALPKANLYIMPDAGHGTLIQRPDEANAVIRRFLD